MSDMERYLHSLIDEDLVEKMVFLSGPRQVGKTTLARLVGEAFDHVVYLNWDESSHKKRFRERRWSPETELLILDEIHKLPSWKSQVKGLFDTRPEHLRILVTGSARLDVFKRGGDSMLGRYHHYRLAPFSLNELHGKHRLPEFSETYPGLRFGKKLDLEPLARFGGFPEPLFKGSDRAHRRWMKDRLELIFKQDIRDLEEIRMFSRMELLGSLLPDRVASPLSVQSLLEDLEVAHRTVQQWLEILERVYFCFSVPPYAGRLERALKKERKYYLWDWSQVSSPGARFENLTAVHLLKWCHFHRDAHGIDARLWYIRDREKREVDFLVTWEKKPVFLVECKLGDERPSASLEYFGSRLGVADRYQISQTGTDDYLSPAGIRIMPAAIFLTGLI